MNQINKLIQSCFQAFQQGHHQYVVQHLSPVFEKLPYHRDIAFIYARSLRTVGQYQLSKKIFNRILTNLPHDVDALCALGNLNSEIALDEQAIACFSKVLAIKPQHFDATYNLARVYLKLDECESAKIQFQNALVIRPHHSGSILGLLSSLEQLDLIHDAIRLAVDELQHAKNAKISIQLASFYKQIGDKASCFDCYKTLVIDTDDRLIVAQSYIHSLLTFGEFEKALEHLKQFVGNNGATEEILDMYWQCLWQTNGKGAIDQYMPLLKQYGDIEAYFKLIARIIKLQEFEVCIALLAESKQLLAKDFRYQLAHGISLRELGEFDKAKSVLKSALDKDPDNAKLSFEYIVTLLCLKEYPKAAELCLALIKQDENQLGHWALYSTCLRLAGRIEEYQELCDYDRLVKVYRLSDFEELSGNIDFEKLAEELKSIHTQNKEPVEQSVNNGSQTVGQLFDHQSPQVQDFKHVISTISQHHINLMENDTEHIHLKYAGRELAFSGSWSVILNSSGFHNNHYHNEGWLSGPCYISLPDAINEKGEGWLKLGQPKLSRWITLEPDYYVKPEVGCLVLFPSYMWHGTVPFESTQKRISIAFDIVPK